MVTELITQAVYALSIFGVPAAVFLGIGSIRWDVRQRGTWSVPIIRFLTLTMWGLIAVYAIGLTLRLRAVPLVVFAVAAAAILLAKPIVEMVAHPPDSRRQAALAVRGVFDLASSRFQPVDVEKVRQELAALDEWVTPATFEYIQLTRALILQWLDGGPSDAANATRWRNRMEAIATEWWPPAIGTRTRDPRRLMRAFVKRWWLPLVSVTGIVIGASIWVSLGPVRAAATIIFAWLVVWGQAPLVLSAGIVSAIVGLAAATALRLGGCRSCDPASIVATVAGISVVGLLVAGYLVVSHRRSMARSGLTLVAPSVARVEDAERPRP